MDNVKFIEIEHNSILETHAIIEREDGSFISMPKSTYDEQQAAMPKQEWVEPQLTK